MEKIGEIRASGKAAHQRIDKVEVDIKESLNKLEAQLAVLNEYMNKGRGMGAVILLLSGIFGAGIFKLIEVFLTKPH